MPPGAKLFLALGALSAAATVALGAFGAHALKARLSAEMLAVYQTGVQYQFWHALGLLCVGFACVAIPQSLWLRAAGLLFITGTLLFSGSLYALALAGIRGIGLLPPLGGVAFVLGWIALGIAALRA